MYEFLSEPCILRCLNSIWKKNFLVILRFYDPSLFCIFCAVSKIRFWQPCIIPNVTELGGRTKEKEIKLNCSAKIESIKIKKKKLYRGNP